MARVSYTNGEWVGELLVHRGVMVTVLKGNEVMYFSTRNTKINNYEMLKKLVDFFVGLNKETGKSKTEENRT